MTCNRLAHQPPGPDLDGRSAVDEARIVDLEQTCQIGPGSLEGSCRRTHGRVEENDQPRQEMIGARMKEGRRGTHKSGSVSGVGTEQNIARR